MTDYPVDLLDEIGWAIASNTPGGTHEQARAVLEVLEADIVARQVAARQAYVDQLLARWQRSPMRGTEAAQ